MKLLWVKKNLSEILIFYLRDYYRLFPRSEEYKFFWKKFKHKVNFHRDCGFVKMQNKSSHWGCGKKCSTIHSLCPFTKRSSRVGFSLFFFVKDRLHRGRCAAAAKNQLRRAPTRIRVCATTQPFSYRKKRVDISLDEKMLDIYYIYVCMSVIVQRKYVLCK